MEITNEITALHKKGDALLAEADKQYELAKKLDRMSAQFPDLRKYVGRWEKVVYYSKTVNTKVARFDMRHNCGCCRDSPLEIWPYVETDLGKVYSDPPSFIVGEKDTYASGDIPHSGWKTKLEVAGIPEIIIGAIGMHFKECADNARERLESVYEDGVTDIEPEL